jgi:flagellar biosynthetic protein FliQ
MNQEYILQTANESIKLTAMLGAPMLLGALVVGIAVSLFQAVTQINEQTLSFIPKVVVVGLTLVVFAPWMIEIISSFTRELYISIPSVLLER